MAMMVLLMMMLRKFKILFSFGVIGVVFGLCAAVIYRRTLSFSTESPPLFVASPTSEIAASTSSLLEVTNIPVFVHFLATKEASEVAKEPAFRTNGHLETMRDLDRALEVFNEKAAQAAGADPRRIRLVRVGVRIAESSEPCPDPLTIVPSYRVTNVINILFQSGDNCVPVANPSIYLRTEAAALPHEMGHMLGLKHTFFANNVPGQAEILARIKDPRDPQSCYLLGDNVCDTPPDYGYRYIKPDGVTDDSNIVCSQDSYPACVQDGPPCDFSDQIIDARLDESKVSTCVSISEGRGRRTYRPGALGLVARQAFDGGLLANDNNVMAYMDQSRFTYEQFLRMYGFTQWRMERSDRVPLSEQKILRGMESGPEDPFGTVGKPTLPDEGWKLREVLPEELKG